MPISIIGGLIAGFVAKKIFEQIWGLIDEEEPPDSSHRQVEWAKLIGAIFRAVKQAADRGSRKAFMGVTGSWPGEERPEKE